jgi:hypothetical protein
LTSAFIRSIYRSTSVENTGINIEDCVHTDWVITNCAELYEYIADRNKHHIPRTLTYRKLADSLQNVNFFESDLILSAALNDDTWAHHF